MSSGMGRIGYIWRTGCKAVWHSYDTALQRYMSASTPTRQNSAIFLPLRHVPEGREVQGEVQLKLRPVLTLNSLSLRPIRSLSCTPYMMNKRLCSHNMELQSGHQHACTSRWAGFQPLHFTISPSVGPWDSQWPRPSASACTLTWAPTTVASPCLPGQDWPWPGHHPLRAPRQRISALQWLLGGLAFLILWSSGLTLLLSRGRHVRLPPQALRRIPASAGWTVAEQSLLDEEAEAALALSRAHYAKALRSVKMPHRHFHQEGGRCVWRDLMVVVGGFNVTEKELDVR